MRKMLNNRKILYLVLGMVIASVFTLSVAYAVLSTTLNITGSTEISSASWDIHLENVKVKEGSVEANDPEISGTSSVSFDVDLTLPGDFYEFTVDVVNDGSIDAMIDSVVKTPELTTDQAKYIKYEITYENGESITTKQILKKETTTPVKVRIEYRKDLSATDLPSTATELSLGLTLVYIQSDGSGNEIPDNGVQLVTVVSGDGTKVGNELCIKEECFYVISSTEDTITMLSKYNLYVGNIYNKTAVPLENPTGKQNETAKGWVSSGMPYIGGTAFSYTSSAYSNSIIEEYVTNYNNYLMTLGITPNEARLITYDELVKLGCNDGSDGCKSAPSWVYATTYWTATATGNNIWFVLSDSYFGSGPYDNGDILGVRPVIIISKNYL